MPPVPPHPFQPYGTSHQIVLGLTLLAYAGLWITSRTRLARLAEKVLGTVLLLIFPASLISTGLAGTLDAQKMLPLQYCDIACIAGGIALWTRQQFCCEILYFFGIAGTLQGLITPALLHDYPDPRFFHFFALHSGVPVAALYAVTAMAHRPRPDSVLRIMLFSLAWFAVAAIANYALGTNYAFQCQKPQQASLFDAMHDWPWYNFEAIGLGVVFYSALYLPFAFRRPAHAAGAAAAGGQGP